MTRQQWIALIVVIIIILILVALAVFIWQKVRQENLTNLAIANRALDSNGVNVQPVAVTPVSGNASIITPLPMVGSAKRVGSQAAPTYRRIYGKKASA